MTQERQDQRDHPALSVIQVQQAPQAQPAPAGLQDQPGLKAIQDRQDPRAHKEVKDPRDRRAVKVQPGLPVPQVLQETRVQRVPQAVKDLQVQQGRRVLPGLRVEQDQQGRMEHSVVRPSNTISILQQVMQTPEREISDSTHRLKTRRP